VLHLCDSFTISSTLIVLLLIIVIIIIICVCHFFAIEVFCKRLISSQTANDKLLLIWMKVNSLSHGRQLRFNSSGLGPATRSRASDVDIWSWMPPEFSYPNVEWRAVHNTISLLDLVKLVTSDEWTRKVHAEKKLNVLIADTVLMKMSCVVYREFSTVEVEAYNRLNGIEPVLPPTEVTSLVLWICL